MHIAGVSTVAVIGIAGTLLASADPPAPRTGSPTVRALSDEYARLMNDMYSNIAHDPPDARLRELTCREDHVNLDRQRDFRLRSPPPPEAIAYYREVVVEPGDATTDGDRGEFTIVEHHPRREPHYQRYSVKLIQGVWKICNSA
jgi:hypothetical protein